MKKILKDRDLSKAITTLKQGGVDLELMENRTGDNSFTISTRRWRMRIGANDLGFWLKDRVSIQSNKSGFGALGIIVGLALALLLGGYFTFFYQICSAIAPPKMGLYDPQVVEKDGKLYRCESLFEKLAGSSGGQRVACTEEAKVCPDGSAVGRTGPNCEFALCPSVASCEGGACPGEIDTSTWKTYRNEKYGFEVRYPAEFFIQENPDGVALFAVYGNKQNFGYDFELKAYGEGINFQSRDEYYTDLEKNYMSELLRTSFGGKLALSDIANRYSFERQRSGSTEILKHKRDFAGLIGNVYQVFVFVKPGVALEFYSESDHGVLDRILSTFKFIK